MSFFSHAAPPVQRATRHCSRETFIIIQENLAFEQVLQRIVIKLLLSVTIRKSRRKMREKGATNGFVAPFTVQYGEQGTNICSRFRLEKITKVTNFHVACYKWRMPGARQPTILPALVNGYAL